MAPLGRVRVVALLVSVVTCLACGGEPPREPLPDWAVALTLQVLSASESEPQLSPARLAEAASAANFASDAPAGAITASAVVPSQDRKTQESVRVLVLALSGELSGASLAVAVDARGSIRGVGIWSRPLFDEDTTQAWEQFPWQFNGRDANPPIGLLSLELRATEWELLQGATDAEAVQARTLTELSSIMRDLGWLYRRSWWCSNRLDEAPPQQWLESYLPKLDRLARSASNSNPSSDRNSPGVSRHR